MNDKDLLAMMWIGGVSSLLYVGFRVGLWRGKQIYGDQQ